MGVDRGATLVRPPRLPARTRACRRGAGEPPVASPESTRISISAGGQVAARRTRSRPACTPAPAGSIVLGNRRIAPSKSLISLMPAGWDGTVVLGSGNWGTPCWRMHCAILTSFAIVCAEGCVVEPGTGRPPPMSFWHFSCAALNAGDEGLIPARENSPPRPGFGSGKLGTPLARMHLANASGPDPAAPGAVEPELVAPPPVAVLDTAVGAARRARRRSGRAGRASPASSHQDAAHECYDGEHAGPPCAGQSPSMDAVLHLVSVCCAFGCAHRFYAAGGFRTVSSLRPSACGQRSVKPP